MQQYLQQIGINAEIKSYDPASWLDLRKSGDMVSFVSSWTADYNDPDNFIYTFFGTPEKSNVRSLNYFNTDVMSRVAAARGIVDDTERLTEYAALEKQIVEEDAAWYPCSAVPTCLLRATASPPSPRTGPVITIPSISTLP